MTVLESVLVALFCFAMVFVILITLLLLIKLNNSVVLLLTGKKANKQGGTSHV